MKAVSTVNGKICPSSDRAQLIFPASAKAAARAPPRRRGNKMPGKCRATFPDSRDFGRIPGFRACARGARAGRTGERMALLREFGPLFCAWTGRGSGRSAVRWAHAVWTGARSGARAFGRSVLCQLDVKCLPPTAQGLKLDPVAGFPRVVWTLRREVLGGRWHLRRGLGRVSGPKGLSLFGRAVFGAKWVHLGQKGAFGADLERW